MTLCDALSACETPQSVQATLRQTLEAYEQWAATYLPAPHNPLMQVEQAAMRRHWPDVAGKRALDLACGTGRYTRLLAEDRAGPIFALDFSAAMLRQVNDGQRIRASMMHLPFVPAAFDVVISGLALGHATALPSWMSEVSRVLDENGILLYSDFHPEAARAGMVRSFKDDQRRTITLPHSPYSVGSQRDAIESSGLAVEALHEIRVGREFQELFPGSDAFYREWDGLPLVLIVRARK